MYSRKTADKASYRVTQSIPPHYGGTRFERHYRSDGREEITDLGLLPIEQSGDITDIDLSVDMSASHEGESSCVSEEQSSEPNEHSGLSDLFSRLGEDDILIIALIILLASEEGDNREVILLLVFLLAAGR